MTEYAANQIYSTPPRQLCHAVSVCTGSRAHFGVRGELSFSVVGELIAVLVSVTVEFIVVLRISLGFLRHWLLEDTGET